MEEYTRIFKARVSDLARAWVGWGTLEPRPYVKSYGPAEQQHEQHKFLAAMQHPEGTKLLPLIDKFYSRFTSNILVKGVFDGLRVLEDTRTGERVISLVEFKTTLGDFACQATKEMAAFQLQLYIWLLEPTMKKLGFKLHKRHYVEIIHRETGKRLERLAVTADPEIVEKIWTLVAEHDGISKSPFEKERTVNAET